MKHVINKRKWKNISLSLTGMFVVATMHFNCAPSLFESAKSGSATLPSVGPLFVDTFEKPNAPVSMLTAEQAYRSMLNVTGQNATTPATAEFATRFGTLSTTDSLSNFNSPLLLSSTSLAGDVCGALVAAEAGSTTRKFFNGVNFGAGPAASDYAPAIVAMARSFWARDPSQAETATFQNFYMDFINGETSNGTLTRNLYIGACSAMLSSFDSLVY